MDRREAMSLPVSASYYGMDSLSNPTANFQSNNEGNLMVSTLPLDTSSTMSPHGMNVGPPPSIGAGPPPAMMQNQPMRRKRGRPRKYGRDLTLSPSTSGQMPIVRPMQKKRGRPPGPSRKPPLVSLGGGFFNGPGKMVPHMLFVGVGEDIKRKILTFAQGRQTTVILSGIGAVSGVNIRISTAGGTVTYEGRFDMLNLSGSYTYNAVHTPHGPVGSISITLSGPDGRVIGGIVEGALIAASPVQVIMGSLLPRSSKPKPNAGENQETSADTEGHGVGNIAAAANA